MATNSTTTPENRPDLYDLSDDTYQDYPATLPAATFARINRSACGINTLAKMLEGSLIADGCPSYGVAPLSPYMLGSLVSTLVVLSEQLVTEVEDAAYDPADRERYQRRCAS